MKENIANPLDAAAIESDEVEERAEAALRQVESARRAETELSVASVTINNETDAFIGIASKAEGNPDLIIPPFGSRTLKASLLNDYCYREWEDQKLISLDYFSPDTASALSDLEGGDSCLRATALGMLFIAFLVVSIPLSVFFQLISWRTIGIVSLLSVILISVVYLVSERRAKARREARNEPRGRKRTTIWQRVWGWLRLTPGILLILATGIGLPFAAVYFFGDGKQLIEAGPHLASLGRLMQVNLIVIASILPALFFYLFGRQQVDIQKDKFYREVMSLDPNVHSLTETKTKYEDLMDSVYGSGGAPLSILLLFISTTLLVTGWILVMGTLDTPALGAKSLADFFIPQRSVLTFALLGAYFFTLNMVFRRYVRADLTPKTYAHITVRLLVTIVLVWVVSSLPQFKSGSVLESGLFAVAFIIGVIPETGLTLIQDYVRKLVNIGTKDQEVLSLNELEGVHLYDRARLLEEGIENIENFAHHNMIELIARTRIPTPRLVDMFDQAVLYLHLGMDESENRKFLAALKSYGIRTATDLDVALKTERSYNCLKSVTPALPLERMEVIYQAFSDDEWYDHLTQWRMSSRKRKEVIRDPYAFYSLSQPPVEGEKPPSNPAPEPAG